MELYVQFLHSGLHEERCEWFTIHVPTDNEAKQELYDYSYYDENGIKDSFVHMSFHEDTFRVLEWHLFNSINAECDLLINMYEDEIAEQEFLPRILEITNAAIRNSDDPVFINTAEEFRDLVIKAIEYGTCVGFYF